MVSLVPAAMSASTTQPQDHLVRAVSVVAEVVAEVAAATLVDEEEVVAAVASADVEEAVVASTVAVEVEASKARDSLLIRGPRCKSKTCRTFLPRALATPHGVA